MELIYLKGIKIHICSQKQYALGGAHAIITLLLLQANYKEIQHTAELYNKVIFRFFFSFDPTVSCGPWIILVSGEQTTVMIIQEVNCPLKSKEETNRLSIYLYLMLQGFCFQLWRVPGKCFLKSLIPGANLNVLQAELGPWSLAHCVYNSWAF